MRISKDRNQKILIKVFENKEIKWVHLCYIDRRLYQKYKTVFENHDECFTIVPHLSRWLKSDFGVSLTISSRKNLDLMKNLIHTWYEKEYPELYIKNCPGTQRISSILSLWITQHMNFELDLAKRRND